MALLANRFDVLWVMGQVGHADSKMTMDVYAQLQQRVKREHGMAFDRLVDQAREQLHGTAPSAPTERQAGGLGHGIGHEPPNAPTRRLQEAIERRKNHAICRKTPEWRDPDSNRGHHDFQSCALPTELSRRRAESVAPASRAARAYLSRGGPSN